MGGMKVAESEEDFERAEPRPEPAAPIAVSDARFRGVAMISALVAGLCVATSVYFLGTTPTAETKIPVNAWMGVAGAVFLVLVWLTFTKLAPKLGYAKGGQGRWARLSAYVGLAIMAAFGAVALHNVPTHGSKWWGGDLGLWSKRLLGVNFTLRPVFFAAVAFFLVSMIGVHVFLNRPRAAEFLIETQGEMKRVSWPTRREWIGSTIVVLVLVMILSFFLFGVDSLLSPLLQSWRIGF